MATIHKSRLNEIPGKEEILKMDNIRKLNPEIVRDDGSIASFKEQLFDFIEGEFNLNYPLVVQAKSKALGYIDGIDDERPLIVPPNTILKIITKHEIDTSVLGKLNSLIDNAPLAFDSITQENNKVVVFDTQDRSGDQIIMAVRLDLSRNGININQIASIYGKEKFERFVENTFEKDLVFYKNENTERFINNTRLQLPNLLISALQDDNIKSFNKSQLESMENVLEYDSEAAEKEVDGEMGYKDPKSGKWLTPDQKEAVDLIDNAIDTIDKKYSHDEDVEF